MKKIAFVFFFLTLFAVTNGQNTFRHLTTAANISGAKSVINDPLTNNKPNAILFISVKWTDNGDSYGNRYRQNAAVQYNTAKDRWMIVNENGSPMPEGVEFNVLVAPENNPNYFTQSGTTELHYMMIDHPATNGKPLALVIVTQNLGSDNAPSPTNDNSQLTFYNQGKWRIGNNNYFLPTCPPGNVIMPKGVKFNVMVIGNGGKEGVSGLPNATAYMHHATHRGKQSITNISYVQQQATWLDRSAVPPNTGTFVFVTPSWGWSQPERPAGMPIAQQYTDSPMAVWFSRPSTDAWSAVNANGVPIREGVLLHVVAVKKP
jgi:hypothetical protein